MLGTLKTFFTKKEAIIDSDPEFYDPEPRSNPNFLTDQVKIINLLKNMEEASPLCTINIGGTNEQFSSSILDIQLENNQIIIDELIPPHGNKLLDNQNTVKLSSIHKGIHLAFKLEQIESGDSRGITFYKTIIPDRVYYPQRRTSPRIHITTFNLLFSGITERTNATIGGAIFDLSRGGLGITIPNSIARFQRGELIRNCHITLNNQTIDFDLTIRFVKNSNKGHRRTLIGGNFENLSSKGKNRLERFIATLEREEIRNRKE